MDKNPVFYQNGTTLQPFEVDEESLLLSEHSKRVSSVPRKVIPFLILALSLIGTVFLWRSTASFSSDGPILTDENPNSLRPYVFYHFEYLLKPFETRFRQSHIKTLKEDFGLDKDSAVKYELNLMSNLEKTFSREYATTITSSEEISEEIMQTLNFDKQYGFSSAMCENLEHLYEEGGGFHQGFANLIKVLVTDPDNLFDATILTLAQHLDFYADSLTADERREIKERFTFMSFHKEIKNPPGTPGTLYQDYYYSRDPSATKAGYLPVGAKFAAPIIVDNLNQWEPVYLQWDQDNVHKNHRLSFGGGNSGLAFYVAKSADVAQGLVSLCDSYDAKHYSHVYFIAEGGCGGSPFGYVFKL
eukprot:gene9507-10321_t